jgi:hypothetical protein
MMTNVQKAYDRVYRSEDQPDNAIVETLGYLEARDKTGFVMLVAHYNKLNAPPINDFSLEKGKGLFFLR